MTTFTDILDRLGGAQPDGDGYLTICPVHGDTNPSLRVTLKSDGRVLMTCRSQGCAFTDIVDAIGLTVADFRSVEAGGEVVTSGTNGAKAPPTSDQIAWLRTFIDESAAAYPGSPAAEYAAERWGISEAQAARLNLGYTTTAVTGDWVPLSWRTVERITVPLDGFDGVPRGLQGRALTDDPTRWCSLRNPDDNAWARLGVLTHDHGDDYFQLGEGPGDGLTAWAAGTSAVFLRGTALASGAINTIVAGLRDKVVLLAGDADRAGRNFNEVMGTALTEAGLDVRVLALPDDIGDVTEWRESSPAAFPRSYSLGLRAAPPFVLTPPVALPPPLPVRTYMNSHEGNAQRLIDRSDGDLAYCPAIGRLVYEGGQWKLDELNSAVHWLTAMTYEMLSEGQALVDEGNATANVTLVERGDALKSWAARSQNDPNFDKSLTRAEKLVAVPVSQLDRHPHLLNVRNGTIDLRTGTLRDHDRGDWLTHRLDIDYDPDAEAPRWADFLPEIFPTQPEMVEWLQRVCGYAATGETVEQCLIVCVGKGANGKSAFWNAIGHVLGPLCGVVPFSAFEKRAPGSSTADLASLRGKRLCLVQEGEANTTLAESVLKRATGGDLVAARNLYKSQMSFQPEFLIVMATNSAPRIKGADEGIWRRIRLSNWTRFFTEDERDPWLSAKLRDESPGILRWIVDGARQWYEGGLGDPPVIKQASRNYRHTSDELAGFIGMVIVPDDDGSILGADLMAAYLDWCIEENVRSWSRRALYGAVVERVEAVQKVKRKDGIHLVGIRLATDADRGDDE